MSVSPIRILRAEYFLAKKNGTMAKKILLPKHIIELLVNMNFFVILPN